MDIISFREQQALEEESAKRGFSAFAAVARHETITARRNGSRCLSKQRGMQRCSRFWKCPRGERWRRVKAR